MRTLGNREHRGRPRYVRGAAIGIIVLGAHAMIATPRAQAQDVSTAAQAEALGAPTLPDASRMSAARRLARLEAEIAGMGGLHDAASRERVLATSLYIGGVTLTLASVSLFVLAGLQGACVAEADLGCYDVGEYVVGGLASGAIAAVLLSGAGFADRRAGYLERRAERREHELEEERERLERRVGLAMGPLSLRLSVAF